MGLWKSLFEPTQPFEKEPKSNQVFEGIVAKKEVHKSINIIMTIDGNSPHDF